MAICCGCSLADDYGTSLANGDGSSTAPFAVEQVDPNFQRPLLRIDRVTDQALTAGVVTTLSFTAEEFDTADMWNVGTPTDIIIPIAGLYLVGFQLLIIGAAASVSELILQQNGLEVYRSENLNGGTNPWMSVVYQIQATSGDIIQAKARSSVGGNASRFMFWACYMGKKV